VAGSDVRGHLAAVSEAIASSIGQQHRPMTTGLHYIDVSGIAHLWVQHLPGRWLLSMERMRRYPLDSQRDRFTPTERGHPLKPELLEAGPHVDRQ
jgi:hypothetical protein